MRARDGLAAAIQDAPKPVGVLAYNDVDAARLVAVCRKEGVGVPEDMAVLGISRSHFDHLFVHETGHSVGKEILAQRLREARRLLSDTDLPIAAIARLTGFCNAGYLSNTFRRAVGVSPKAWRRTI